MKKILSVFTLALLLSLGSSPLAAQESQPDPSASSTETGTPEIPDPPMPPLYSFEPEKDDSPQTLQFKAALRLFKAYNVTMGLMTKCKDSNPEAGAALGQFGSRNGSTLGQVMSVIKRHGGFTPTIKKSLDLKIAEEINSSATDCRALISEVQNGARDIYKAEQHLDDYNLMRGR